MSAYIATPCHINTIKPGDTVLHLGQLITMSPSTLKRGGFLGTTIQGDSYRAGSIPALRVVFQAQA